MPTIFDDMVEETKGSATIFDDMLAEQGEASTPLPEDNAGVPEWGRKHPTLYATVMTGRGMAKPVLGGVGGLLGGIAGAGVAAPTVVGTPVGALAGAGLGYAAGEAIGETIDVALGLKAPRTAEKAIRATAGDIAIGALGGVGSKATVGAGKLISSTVTPEAGEALARNLYGRALKPSTNMPTQEREAILKTGLERAVSGKSYRPSASHIEALSKDIKALTDDADELVLSLTSKKEVPPLQAEKLASGIDKLVADLSATGTRMGEVNALMKIKKDFLAKHAIPPQRDIYGVVVKDMGYKPIPLADAIQIRKSVSNLNKKLYAKGINAMSELTAQAEDAIAKAINAELSASVPRAGKQYQKVSELIDLEKIMQKAYHRTSNREPVSLLTTTTAAAGSPSGVATVWLMTSANVQSVVAKHIAKLSISAREKARLLSELKKMSAIPITEPTGAATGFQATTGALERLPQLEDMQMPKEPKKRTTNRYAVNGG